MKQAYTAEKRAAKRKHKMYPLSQNLRAIRARMSVSGEAIARQAGIDPMTLSKLETGNFVLLDPDVLLVLCDIYDTTPNDLLGYQKGGTRH